MVLYACLWGLIIFILLFELWSAQCGRCHSLAVILDCILTVWPSWARTHSYILLLFSFEYYVTRCLKLLLPWLPCHGGLTWTVSWNKSILPWVAHIRIFYNSNWNVPKTANYHKCTCWNHSLFSFWSDHKYKSLSLKCSY